MMKVAVEGCGHGTLHAIYASLEESCRVRGWDGVDVLIIGGDFQAVRNQLDLNVTAMPAKFRKMADFHEYYSGARTAPCLTVFVGGNHEASNHLFELYYGGWVAPNIYYLGAANVIRVGPLRIAALSGIWKGYDYRKPHFERLPYNRDDIQSIYHVRELDVRKLLSVRTQVDVGISHDWPQGVEWAGDHEWLFQKKDLFEADARNGKLGSIAAKHCLDRLRPIFWVSAHLHIKYVATVQHGAYRPIRPSGPARKDTRNVDLPSEVANSQTSRMMHTQTSHALPQANNPSLSAWQNFHLVAAEEDATEAQRVEKERETAGGANTSGVAQYHINETWRQVETDDNMHREVTSVSESSHGKEPTDKSMGYDGCCESKESQEFDEDRPIRTADGYTISEPFAYQRPGISAVPGQNQDEIDVDMSDSSEDATGQPSQQQAQTLPILGQNEGQGRARASSGVNLVDNAQDHVSVKEELAPAKECAALMEDDVQLKGISVSKDNSIKSKDPTQTEEGSTPMKAISNLMEEDRSQIKDDHTLMGTSQDEGKGTSMPEDHIPQPQKVTQKREDDVSSDLRAELAALSTKFRPISPVMVSAPLPLPNEIANKSTEFLALDKCEPNRDFMQLLEIKPISTTIGQEISRPFKLQYDPEWLAIQRSFDGDLELGGDPQGTVPQHLGDTSNRNRIITEEAWVQENIVLKGKLAVPDNFVQTAPVYDPNVRYNETQMPREYTNPQTSAYCALIGIRNKFDISEAQRNERMAAGPRQDKENSRRGGRSRGGQGHSRGGRAGGQSGRGGWSGSRGGHRW